MESILVQLIIVQMCSEDLHYFSGGESFYALHLLGDRVKDDVQKHLDEIREVYYMGEMETTPPQSKALYYAASEKAFEVIKPTDNRILLLNLDSALKTLVCLIEQFKTDKSSELASGTVAVLDSISMDALNSVALIRKSIPA